MTGFGISQPLDGGRPSQCALDARRDAQLDAGRLRVDKAVLAVEDREAEQWPGFLHPLFRRGHAVQLGRREASAQLLWRQDGKRRAKFVREMRSLNGDVPNLAVLRGLQLLADRVRDSGNQHKEDNPHRDNGGPDVPC